MIKPPSGSKTSSDFHFNYPQYIERMDEENCPICNYETHWENHDLIVKMEHATLYSSIKAKGGLWGSCVIVSKKHVVEITDFAQQDAAGFMSDLQKTARALKEVTQAVKINIEQQGNTIPHLHIYLFPRYIDDLNAGKPINYKSNTLSVYESKMEYDYFIHQMRKHLSVETPQSNNRVKKDSIINQENETSV